MTMDTDRRLYRVHNFGIIAATVYVRASSEDSALAAARMVLPANAQKNLSAILIPVTEGA